MSENGIIMIAAGGTGGHVVPALNVAKELQRCGYEVVWLGTQAGIESRLVVDAGIDIDWLSVSGLRGKGVFAWFLAPLQLLRACCQAFAAIWRRKPRALLGMGGFVAGPAGVAAKLLLKPLIIHEQNAIAGTTNRWLAPWSDAVLAAVPTTFPKNQTVLCVGNPVDVALQSIEDPEKRLYRSDKILRVLVIGGSQGADILNKVVPIAVKSLNNIQLWHQAGRNGVVKTKLAYDANNADVRVEPFIDNMKEAYSWADLVVSRAGAMSVSELSASGCASILVPYPFAIDDHQTANCAEMVKSGAAIHVPQSEFNADVLSGCLKTLRDDRKKLVLMAQAARQLSVPHSARKVAEIVMERAL